MKFPALFWVAALALLAGFARAEPPEWSGKPDVSVTVKTTEGTMRYDLSEFNVPASAKVRLTVENADQLQHNMVVLNTGTDDANGLRFATEVWGQGEAALARGWLPADTARVLASTRLLDPQAKEDLYFVAPEEPGDYPFVCTVPGHAMIMNGVMKVRAAKPAFQDLRYSLYEGEWQKLPDFAALKPAASGPVPGGLITLDVLGERKLGKFGLVFDGTFEVKATDEYEFLLGSDDGSRLIIDGEGELESDGIHPFGTVRKKLTLEKGIHTLQLQYFEGGGQKALALGAKRKKGGLLALSTEATAAFGKAPEPAPVIPIRPLHAGEAVIYRNFIEGSSPRGIAVGYPGGVNICWDADTCNVAMLWRGAFMDAGRHWTGRGQGNQPPMGFDVFAPAPGYPWQALESPEETWIPFSLVQIKSEKDNPAPEKEITIKVPHPDYRFRGYRLDAKRFPTFSYDFRKLRVEDRFAPSTAAEGVESLERTLVFTGDADAGLNFRVGASVAAPDAEGWHAANGVAVRVEGAGTELRAGAGGSELLVPVKGAGSFKVHYRWLAVIGGKASASN